MTGEPGPELKLGELAVQKGWCTQKQVADCLQAQRVLLSFGVQRLLGDIMCEKKVLSRSQVEELLREQGLEADSIRRELAGYQILERVGQGGNSIVFRALQSSMNRIVALKVLSPRSATKPSSLQHFKQEAALLGRINHPNIVNAIDMGEDEGFHYLVLEFIEGRTIAERVRQEGALPPHAALRIARDIAFGLQELERQGIVHGDMKPGNVLMASHEIPKIADLGLAVRNAGGTELNNKAGRVFGTAYYLSPEQVLGQGDLDSRTDIYSLGVTLFEMLVGESPFQACSKAVAMHKHLSRPLPWPRHRGYDVPDRVVRLVQHMTEKDREKRPRDFVQLLEKMDALLAGESPYPPLVHVRLDEDWPGLRKLSPASDETGQRLIREQALATFLQVRNRLLAELPEDLPRDASLLGYVEERLTAEEADKFVKVAMVALTENDLPHAREYLMRARQAGAKIDEAVHRLDCLMAPAGMVFVPEGECLIGSNEAPEEAPERREFVKAFYVDESPVTNEAYADFCRATGHAPPKHWPSGQCGRSLIGFPVVNVDWSDAVAFAKWADKKLPSELEWEKAARGAEGLAYPWGNRFKGTRCNWKGSEDQGICLAGKYTKCLSPYGCYDMVGNVEEWTSDWYAPYPGSSAHLPLGPRMKVTRGGSYQSDERAVRSSARALRDPRMAMDFIGFRCAKDL